MEYSKSSSLRIAFARKWNLFKVELIEVMDEITGEDYMAIFESIQRYCDNILIQERVRTLPQLPHVPFTNLPCIFVGHVKSPTKEEKKIVPHPIYPYTKYYEKGGK